MRRLTGKTIILASHNQGKCAEFAHAFKADALTIISAAEKNLPEPEETGARFVDNALLKARAAAQATNMPALADDSGLAVAALDGAPGIYSARWAGPQQDYDAAFTRIAKALVAGGKSDMSAAFVCVLALVWPDGTQVVAEGQVAGQLVFPPRGAGGFGYDPIFIPQGDSRVFAEMTPDEKAVYSHRHRAIEALRPLIFDK